LTDGIDVVGEPDGCAVGLGRLETGQGQRRDVVTAGTEGGGDVVPRPCAEPESRNEDNRCTGYAPTLRAGTDASGAPCRSGGSAVSSGAAAAPRDLGAERIQPLVPEGPEPAEPGVDLAQRLGVDGVDPPGSLGAHGGETALPQDSQVLRHRGLRDAELLPDDGGQRTRSQLLVRQQFEDPPPDRIAQDVE